MSRTEQAATALRRKALRWLVYAINSGKHGEHCECKKCISARELLTVLPRR